MKTTLRVLMSEPEFRVAMAQAAFRKAGVDFNGEGAVAVMLILDNGEIQQVRVEVEYDPDTHKAFE
jgi:hypothetical protein